MMPADDSDVKLRFISFNMHGFHQGCPVIEDLIVQNQPDIFLLQEHWLTPANIVNFNSRLTDYFSIGQRRRSLLKSGGGIVRRAKGRSLGRGYAPLQLGSGGLPPEKFG